MRRYSGELEASVGTLRFDRLEGLYYFSIFGTPGSAEPWGWQVDGHHLSLNMTVIGGERIFGNAVLLRSQPGGGATRAAQGPAHPEGGGGRREESPPFPGRRAGAEMHDLPYGAARSHHEGEPPRRVGRTGRNSGEHDDGRSARGTRPADRGVRGAQTGERGEGSSCVSYIPRDCHPFASDGRAVIIPARGTTTASTARRS